MGVIEMYADLTCPFAYVVHSTWRSLRPEFGDRAQVSHMSLALEYVNSAPTPKDAIESELPFLFTSEPDVPWQPWSAPASTWPVTVWPAFEAVKCAELQDPVLADDLAWAIRVAFFAHSRCISMRHELLDLARDCGLDASRFEADLDSGVAKANVIAEARRGWEELRVPGSPTWVLPDGSIVSEFGLIDIQFDENGLPTGSTPGLSPARRQDALRELIEGRLDR